MQPYLFPYIGYFQLIHAVDCFVIHDDVQWIKGGWINRNRILTNGDPCMITLPVQRPSSTSRINECTLPRDTATHQKKLLNSIHASYRKAAHFAPTYELIASCLDGSVGAASEFITPTIQRICDHLHISTPILVSSELNKDASLKGQDRVIDINLQLNADYYINPIGGTELYSFEAFSAAGLSLSFLSSRSSKYSQINATSFHPNLSIIDVLMHNGADGTSDLLHAYELIPASEDRLDRRQ